jgi:hypothetical protein
MFVEPGDAAPRLDRFDAEPWSTAYGETCPIGGDRSNPRLAIGTRLFAPSGRRILA